MTGSASEEKLPNPDEVVLCVDDDMNILEAYRRQLRRQFNIQVALGPERGLDALTKRGNIAVVISDLRMPGMDGTHFLAAVRTRCPHAVRVMLTGQADLASAVAAVNQGNIFRFLIKPCSPTVLALVVEACLQQHRLMVGEQQLTQRTLLGAIHILVEVLRILQPDTFSRAHRLRRYVQHMASKLVAPSDVWKFEAAAMLSQIGWILLPAEIVSKVSRREHLNEHENTQFRNRFHVARKMIDHIPRLEAVGQMIEGQEDPYSEQPPEGSTEDGKMAALGAQMLKIANAFEEFRRDGANFEESLRQLRLARKLYHPDLVRAFSDIAPLESAGAVQRLYLHDLVPGMILEQTISTVAGLCLLGEGQEITETTLQRLLVLSHSISSPDGFLVRVRPKPIPDGPAGEPAEVEEEHTSEPERHA